MCFTPFVSITIAIIELCLAVILVSFFPKTTLRNFFALLILVLGFYQFTEFMLCTSGNSLLWARIGFITYTFLPAIGLHTTIRFVNKKPNLLGLYSIPVVISILAFFFKIVTDASCQRFFVQTNILFNQIKAPFSYISFAVYDLYYFGFIIASCLLFYYDYKKQRNIIRKKISLVEISGILFMTVSTWVFLVIFPFLGKRFPSVLCGFAIFVAIAAFYAAYLEGKLTKKR